MFMSFFADDQLSNMLQTASDLRHLELHECGVITEACFQGRSLTNLEQLDLGYLSSLTNALWTILPEMPQLLTLNIRSCKSLTTMGIDKLYTPNLQILRLERIKIHAESISAFFVKVPSLRILEMRNSDISDRVVWRHRSWQSLENLYLTCMEGIGDDLFGLCSSLPQLQVLDMHGCPHITGAGLSRLTMPKLRTLDLSRTAITDESFAAFPEMNHLQALHMHGCLQFTGSGFASRHFPKLETVDFCATVIDKKHLMQFPQMPCLRWVSIEGRSDEEIFSIFKSRTARKDLYVSWMTTCRR
jgi:hypothetical protein